MEFAGNNVGSSIFLNQLAWAPPDPPQGDIIHYNVRITSVTNESEIFVLVEGVNDTFLDVKPFVLSDGEYFIQVCIYYMQCEILLYSWGSVF